MTSISPAVKAAQNQARRQNGEFGNQQHSTPDTPSKSDHYQALHGAYGDVDRAAESLQGALLELHAAEIVEHFPEDISRVETSVVRSYDDGGYPYQYLAVTAGLRSDGKTLSRAELLQAGADLSAADGHLKADSLNAASRLDRDSEETATLDLGTGKRDPAAAAARVALARQKTYAAAHSLHAAEDRMIDASARVLASNLADTLPKNTETIRARVVRDYDDGFYCRLEFEDAVDTDGISIGDGADLGELADTANGRGGFEIAGLANERGDSEAVVTLRGESVGFAWR